MATRATLPRHAVAAVDGETGWTLSIVFRNALHELESIGLGYEHTFDDGSRVYHLTFLSADSGPVEVAPRIGARALIHPEGIVESGWVPCI
jgi:hypothetical protein